VSASILPERKLPSDRPFESFNAIQHIILDRDGVLNEEPTGDTYLSDPQDFRWLPGALNAVVELHEIGIRVSVATNQSGIGRGLMSEDALNSVHNKMTADVRLAKGRVEAVFHCPHAPEAQCGCRKPAPGLIVAAVDQSGISRANTLVVGDAIGDLEAARSAGAYAALVRTGKGRQSESYAVANFIPVFDDLAALVSQLAIEGQQARLNHLLQAVFAEHITVATESATHLLPAIAECVGVSRTCLSAGNKILACGNGGSAADAQHFVAELVGRYAKFRPALSAVVLAADSATFSAVSNDFGFDQVFARQVDALARSGDVLIAISTSGNSPNVVNAAIRARAKGCSVIALTGRSGGTIRVPSETVARVQEIHELCLHSLAQALDSTRLESKA
jgi:histidinol-phosphate phosphatase family protein